MSDETRGDTHKFIAFAVLAIFAMQNVAPYFLTFPEGQGGTMIVSTGKTVENIIMLVIGYYFGSTQESKKKTDALADTAAVAAAATPPGGSTTVTQTPAADVTIAAAETPKP